MGRKPFEIGQYERIAIGILANKFDNTDLTHQAIADRIGMSRSGVLKTLAGQRATTISEFEALASALGLVAWRVMRQAETGILSEPVSTVMPSDLGLAANPHAIEPEQGDHLDD